MPCRCLNERMRQFRPSCKTEHPVEQLTPIHVTALLSVFPPGKPCNVLIPGQISNATSNEVVIPLAYLSDGRCDADQLSKANHAALEKTLQLHPNSPRRKPNFPLPF
jgi:hypothetical protein